MSSVGESVGHYVLEYLFLHKRVRGEIQNHAATFFPVPHLLVQPGKPARGVTAATSPLGLRRRRPCLVQTAVSSPRPCSGLLLSAFCFVSRVLVSASLKSGSLSYREKVVHN